MAYVCLTNLPLMERTPVSFYTVRFNDCDPLGHLNNARYLDYFLNAREDHLRDHYGIDLRVWLERGDAFVVHSHEIRYLRPAVYNESVAIQSALIGAGDSWLLVEMQLFDREQQQLKAILWTRFTHINPKTGRKEPLSAELVDFVKEVLVEGVDLSGGVGARVEALRSL
jgi:YbgC/YbaW family acyl-CoA thioester hydrolase